MPCNAEIAVRNRRYRTLALLLYSIMFPPEFFDSWSSSRRRSILKLSESNSIASCPPFLAFFFLPVPHSPAVVQAGLGTTLPSLLLSVPLPRRPFPGIPALHQYQLSHLLYPILVRFVQGSCYRPVRSSPSVPKCVCQLPSSHCWTVFPPLFEQHY
jgi:hypothetical protein